MMTSIAIDRVFAIVDDKVARESIASLIRLHGVEAHVYESREQFMAQYDGNDLGCLVIDMHAAATSGVELQRWVTRAGIGLPIIMVTAHRDVQTAVAAMRYGAVTCLEKPFGDHDLDFLLHSAPHFVTTRRIDPSSSLTSSSTL